MNKVIIVVVALAVIGLGGYFLLKDRGATVLAPVLISPSPTSPSPTVLAPIIQKTPSSGQNIITYTDTGGYSPPLLTIKKGETVIFKNQSSRTMWPASAAHPNHTVYNGTSLGQHCPDSSGSAFDACRQFSPGQTWSFKFDKTGTWRYHDHLNPGSIGTVVVE